MTSPGNNRMNVRMALCAAFLALATSASFGASPARIARGIEFPAVPLSEGSSPHYAGLALNPFTNSTTLFVLFDGNVKSGYNRAYLWCPDDAQYGTPVAIACGEDRRFPPVSRSTKSPGGSDAAIVSWSLRWAPQSSGGTHTYFDYVSGKQVTVQRANSTWPVFVFQCALGMGDAASVARQSFPLDITIPGELRVTRAATNLPAGTAPWNQLVYGMTAKHTPGDRKQNGAIQLNGWLRHQNGACTVRALPAETKVDLMVSPYMEPAIYSNVLAGMQAFAPGAKVSAPSGWYQFWWRMSCPGLRVGADWHGLYPMTQKLPAASGGGGTAE